MRNNRLIGALLALVVSFSLATAHADAALSIIDTYPFTVNSNPSGLDFIGVHPFDPSLGTLDKVAVTIIGQMTLQGFAPTNFVPTTAPTPIPYAYNIRVEQTFDGLAGKFFTFETPGQFLFAGVALGVGEPLVFQRSFSYTFNFDNLTDIIGLVLPSTTGVAIPPIISGQRPDFLATFLPLNEIDLLQQVFAFSIGPPLQGLVAMADGSLTIQYDYAVD